MAYTSFTPSSSSCLRKINSAGIASPGGRWKYESTDGSSLVSVSSYITDAYKLGTQVGDILEQFNSSANTVTEYVFTAVRATSASAGAGSADLSAGQVVSS